MGVRIVVFSADAMITPKHILLDTAMESDDDLDWYRECSTETRGSLRG